MQALKSIVRRLQSKRSQSAQKSTVVGSRPVPLTESQLKQVAGGLPYVPVTGNK